MKDWFYTLILIFFPLLSTAENSLVGGWYFGPGYPSNNGIVITFFADGTFYMAEDGVPEAGGGPGMERGSYSFDAEQQSLNTTVIDDTSGNWGLSHAFITQAELNGDTLTVKVAGEPFPFVFSRIGNNQNLLLGSWYSGPGFPRDNGLVISFLMHGNYFLAEDGVADDGGGPGMERGDYHWDGANSIGFNGGALQGMPWRDTSGDWGLSHAVITNIQIDGDKMTVTIQGEGNLQFFRVPARQIAKTAIPLPRLALYALFCLFAGTAISHQFLSGKK